MLLKHKVARSWDERSEIEQQHNAWEYSWKGFLASLRWPLLLGAALCFELAGLEVIVYRTFEGAFMILLILGLLFSITDTATWCLFNAEQRRYERGK